MKTILMATAAAGLLLTSACMDTGMGGGSDAATGGMASASDMTPTAAMPYVAMAGASDQYEIQSSQLALQQATSPAVKQFAQMMIQHHTQTTQQLMTAAQSAGLTPPPPQLMPMQARMIADLQGKTGASFDRTYIQQQTKAHQMALALHSTYARDGDTPALKQAAAAATPIVQQHLDQIRGMRAS
jgi:putative membrane protein